MLMWYVFGLVLVLIVSCEYFAWKTGVPTVTSMPSSRKMMIELLAQEAARRKKTTPFTILDLGSGTGKLALEIGRALPSARVVGLEISLVPFLLSLLRRLLWRGIWKVGNVDFLRQDFWLYDVSNVDAVVIYINGNIRDRMAQKLTAELSPTSIVISNETHLPDWTPVEIHSVGLLKIKIVVYKKA